ncbi:MAG: bifunctional endoribonuclease/protein kinase ire1 [Watsoniomyces obsoletus]|nr:MAG: bifunctional endoribonuclease/protein kinase ire1 [Watsoniomyces obsoletus]
MDQTVSVPGLLDSIQQQWLAKYDPEKEAQKQNQRDLYTQLVISTALGLIAFVSFCILRPRWRTLYAARKQQSNRASSLPELPDTFFGWIPTLYRITDGEVLRSAGLDAFVFLNFFRMAIKFLTVAFFAVLIVMTPVRKHFGTDTPQGPPRNDTGRHPAILASLTTELPTDGHPVASLINLTTSGDKYPPGYFWMHVIFVYLFTALLFHLVNQETKKVIKIRQEYLGSQSTVTDRTIRLSGIPEELRSEEKLQEFIENLEIGKVESMTLCRDWSELDHLMDERAQVLRRLEEAWAVYLGRRQVERNRETLPIAQPPPPEPLASDESAEEDSGLLNDGQSRNVTKPYAKKRPITTIRFGFLKLKSQKVDAIDYYEEKLRRLDEKIKETRQKEFQPTALAFITLDSIAAAQMAVQAILDPSPSRLIAHVAPAPPDIVWRNTYQSRTSRMARAWSITVFVGVLSIFWSALLVPVAALLEIEQIRKVLPGFGAVLDEHKVLKSLVQTGLPTLVLSLLAVAVPYIYDWLSNMQGMISQGEVELSVISKNFFFTFYNLFIFYTVLGSATNLTATLDSLKDALKDTSYVANQLASRIEDYGQFFINLIILQGLGLLPLRLLEFGSVSLYPITLMGAKTPRDFAELVQPPVFKYGFFLPQTLLIFIICIVYSVLPSGLEALLFGLIYFIIGYFTYKYQLLYAMDHNQHSTGKAWPIICYRAMLGAGVFQIAMVGWLALRGAFEQSALTAPLVLVTIWFSYFYGHSYEPLTKFIALSSVQRHKSRDRRPSDPFEENVWRSDSGDVSENSDPITVDEARERGLTFMNPNLVSP